MKMAELRAARLLRRAWVHGLFAVMFLVACEASRPAVLTSDAGAYVSDPTGAPTDLDSQTPPIEALCPDALTPPNDPAALHPAAHPPAAPRRPDHLFPS